MQAKIGIFGEKDRDCREGGREGGRKGGVWRNYRGERETWEAGDERGRIALGEEDEGEKSDWANG